MFESHKLLTWRIVYFFGQKTSRSFRERNVFRNKSIFSMEKRILNLSLIVSSLRNIYFAPFSEPFLSINRIHCQQMFVCPNHRIRKLARISVLNILLRGYFHEHTLTGHKYGLFVITLLISVIIMHPRRMCLRLLIIVTLVSITI